MVTNWTFLSEEMCSKFGQKRGKKEIEEKQLKFSEKKFAARDDIVCVPCAHRTSLKEAYEMVRSWTLEDHEFLRANVPKYALQTPWRDGTIQDVAKRVGATRHEFYLASHVLTTC